MAEFLANNHVNKSIGMTLFLVDNGFHPCTGVEAPRVYEGGRKAELLAADRIITNQEKTLSYLQDQLTWSQQEQTHWADQNCQPHSEYKVGDIVYVNAGHFSTSNRESKLLSMKNAGPWKITRNIAGKAYELDIPQHINDAGLTPVFHLWKLHLALTDLFPGQIVKPGPPVMVNSSDEDKAHEKWEILELVDSQKTKKYGVQYKATYMGNWDN